MNSNLDFKSLDQLEEIDGQVDNIVIKDQMEVISVGTYKNGIFEMLEIPFFKHDDAPENDNQVCLAF